MLPDSVQKSQSHLVAEVLLSKGVLTRDQLQQAVAQAKSSRRGLSHSLVSLGLIPEAALLRVLSAVYRVRSADVSHITKIPPTVLETLNAAVAKRNLALPLRRRDGTLTVAVANPANEALLAQLRQVSGLEIEPVVATDFALFEAIKKYYKPQKETDVAATSEPVPAAPSGNPESPSTPEPEPAAASATPAPAEPPGAKLKPDEERVSEAKAARAMLTLDNMREKNLSDLFSGKGVLVVGVAMFVLGTIITTLSYDSASQGNSYFVTTGLFFAGLVAFVRGFFTLDD